MLRRLIALTLAAALCAAPAAMAAGDVGDVGGAHAPLAGTWTGTLAPESGSHATAHRLTVTVNARETAGTWRIGPSCHGLLRLKDISYGYHHYTEVAAAGTRCKGGGVDCLKRVGAKIEDVFVSRPGTSLNATGLLRRTR